MHILPVRQEQLQERLGQRFHELDTPLRVDWADGRREAVVFALEEETDAGRFSAYRLARYCLDLAELLETDRVVPVSIFLRAGAAPATVALGTERGRYLTFDFLACRLYAMDAGEWRDSDNPVALANLPNMRRPPDMDRVDMFARAAHGLRALEPDGGKLAKYVRFIDIYAALTENEQESYRRRYPEENKTMAGMFQRAHDEGMRQGMRLGRVDGERTVLERLLQRRFGPLSPAVAERLQNASASDLEAWAENVLDARAMDDVFDPGAHKPAP